MIKDINANNKLPITNSDLNDFYTNYKPLYQNQALTSQTSTSQTPQMPSPQSPNQQTTNPQISSPRNTTLFSTSNQSYADIFKSVTSEIRKKIQKINNNFSLIKETVKNLYN